MKRLALTASTSFLTLVLGLSVFAGSASALVFQGPTSIDQCRGNGWRNYWFQNQRECYVYVTQHGGKPTQPPRPTYPPIEFPGTGMF